MKKTIWLSLTLSAILMLSCKENDSVIPNPNISSPDTSTTTRQSSPIPLATGNFWVYDRYKIEYDSIGRVTKKEFTNRDTIRVIGDTTINQQLFHHISGCLTCSYTNFSTKKEEFLRVQEGTIYSEKEKTFFSTIVKADPFTLIQDFDDLKLKTDYRTIKSLENIQVPAGTYNNSFLICGDAWMNSNGSYDRRPFSDPFYSFDPSVGLLELEQFFANPTDRKIGFRSELIAFNTNSN